MSLLQELAKAVMAGDEDRTGLADDVRAMLRDGATALKADLEAGTASLIGALPAIYTLDVAPVDLDAPDTALAITPVTAPGGDTPTRERGVELPLPAGLAEPVGTIQNVLDADPAAGAGADDPIQLSLFGDSVVAPPKPSRRGRIALTRGVPAAA